MPRRLPENTLRTRDEFFAREQAAWEALTKAWTGIPSELLLTPGSIGDRWSVKDLMNHLAAWQDAAIRVIGDLLVGKWGRLGANTDSFNKMQYELDHDRSLTESRARLERTHQALLKLLASLSDDQLLNEYGRQQIGWWAKWTTYAHYEEHLADLTDFRRKTQAPNES
ncbi:MAG TPA: DinB family protein [Anaerolineales bacterium]|nr:DinB family protein [Anaerolineales bacterium]